MSNWRNFVTVTPLLPIPGTVVPFSEDNNIPQALDPIPTFNRGPVGAPGCAGVSKDQESLDPTTAVGGGGGGGGGDSTSAGSQTALAGGANPSGGYTSFPVDVIVYFHMQVIVISSLSKPSERSERGFGSRWC